MRRLSTLFLSALITVGLSHADGVTLAADTIWARARSEGGGGSDACYVFVGRVGDTNRVRILYVAGYDDGAEGTDYYLKQNSIRVDKIKGTKALAYQQVRGKDSGINVLSTYTIKTRASVPLSAKLDNENLTKQQRHDLKELINFLKYEPADFEAKYGGANPPAAATDTKSPVAIVEHKGITWEWENVGDDELVLTLRDGTMDFLTANGCMESHPRLSFDDSIVAFLRRVDSNEDGEVRLDDETELWVLRLRNRAESRLAETLKNPSPPTWHPSGLKLAFIATDLQEGRGLYTYDLPSRTLTRLTDGAETGPAWSLNGDYIAYYDAKKRVALVSVAGRDVKVLTEVVGEGPALAWTADDSLVFAQEAAKDETTWHIYSPKTMAASKLDDAGRRNLNYVDQQKFGWASTKAHTRR